MSDVKEKLEATIYSDGGCKPSRGRGGWGIHANIDGTVYDGWGSFKEDITNNIAEVTAAFEGVKLAISKGVTDLTLKSDSQYMLDGITKNCKQWVKNNWLRKDGEPVANKDIWKNFYSYIKDNTDNIKINWKWVKGHAGNAGNEWADRNASLGVIASQKSEVVSFLKDCPAKKHNTFKVPDYNRMFSHARWYFNSNVGGPLKTKDGLYIYHCGNHGKVDELIGKPASDTTHSVLMLKEPEPVLEHIRNYQDILVPGDDSTVMVARLDNIFGGKIYNDILENGFLHMQPNRRTRDIINVDETPVTNEARPPRLAYNLLEMLSNLEHRLSDFRQGITSPTEHSTDVTSLLYDVPDETSKKSKYMFSSEIPNTVKFLEMDIRYCLAGGEESGTKLKLTLGIDLPSRNALSAMTKLKPKVHILTWAESDKGFRYATVIETECGIGIWTAGHSNLRVI